MDDSWIRSRSAIAFRPPPRRRSFAAVMIAISRAIDHGLPGFESRITPCCARSPIASVSLCVFVDGTPVKNRCEEHPGVFQRFSIGSLNRGALIATRSDPDLIRVIRDQMA